MSSQQLGSQRRQFSRRDTSRSAIALIAGFAPVTCELRNVSEGGALIAFGNSYVPDKPFRLTIEGMTLSCEVRHSSSNGIGVRFLNLSDGMLLIKQLYQQPVAAPSQWKPETEVQSAPVSGRSLREGLRVARGGTTGQVQAETVQPIAELPSIGEATVVETDAVVTLDTSEVAVSDVAEVVDLAEVEGLSEVVELADARAVVEIKETPAETSEVAETTGEAIDLSNLSDLVATEAGALDADATFVFLKDYAEQIARAEFELQASA